MNRSTLRVCAPCIIASVLASTALKATDIASKLSTDFDLEPGRDYGVSITDNGQLQMTLQGTDAINKLAGIKMPSIDADDDDQRFFQQDDDGRYVATVEYKVVAEMLQGKKSLTEARWNDIVARLVPLADVQRLPAPATRKSADARATA